MPKIDENRKKERRQKIIEAALECFSSSGYTNTTMDHIVKQSGISKGGIYLYFKSKEDIFRDIADEVMSERSSSLEKINTENISSSEKFRVFVGDIVRKYNQPEYRKKISFSFEFWVESRDKQMIGNVSRNDYLEKRFGHAAGNLETILKEGQADGEFREDIDVQTTLYCLMAAMDGMAFFTGVLNKLNPENSADILAEIFLTHLRKK